MTLVVGIITVSRAVVINNIDELENKIDVKATSVEDTLAFNSSAFDSKVIDVAAGIGHNLFLTENGTVYSNGPASAELGNPEIIGYDGNIYQPLKIPNVNNGFTNTDPNDKVVKIKASTRWSMILTESGKIYGFGDNTYGQLGLGYRGNPIWEATEISTTNYNVFDSSVKDMCLQLNGSIFLTESGTLYSVGYNGKGELGIGKTQESDYNDDDNNGRVDLYERSELTIQKIKNSTASGVGFINGSTTNPVVKIACGYMHTLALTQNNTLYTIGNNAFGQLGNGEVIPDGSLTIAEQFSKVSNSSDGGFTNGTTGILAISGGHRTTSIITAEGKIYSFGENTYGSLGIPEVGVYPIPTQPYKKDYNFVNSNFIDLGYQFNHVVALKSDGSLWAVGNNTDGRLGIGQGAPNRTFEFREVVNDKGLFSADNRTIKISAGGWKTVYLKEDGTVYTSGQIHSQSSEKIYAPILYDFEKNTFNLSGIALSHSKTIKTKFSSNAVITNVGNSDIFIKEKDGTFIDITNEYFNGLNGKFQYVIGEGTTLVKQGEEKEFTIKVVSSVIPTQSTEYTFIVDKKPPSISQINEKCNFVDNIYYCNKDINLQLSSDISNFESATKDGVSIQISPEGILDTYTFSTSKIEEKAIRYIFTDGAGNKTTEMIIFDNNPPRIDLK